MTTILHKPTGKTLQMEDEQAHEYVEADAGTWEIAHSAKPTRRATTKTRRQQKKK